MFSSVIYSFKKILWFQHTNQNKINIMTRVLVAFDFDHTVIDGNSDIVVRNVLPSGNVPRHIQEMVRKGIWTEYMQQIFLLLHDEGVSPAGILGSITGIPPTKGMLSLLEFLQRPDCEVIIISDSNSVFIDAWLEAANLSGAVSKVYTNPAYFDSKGLLCISMYHEQNWCDLSEVNMCKGHILETHIKDRLSEGISYAHIAYVGDGKNDLCPSLRLSDSDLAFARVGFSLEKILEGSSSKRENMKAKVHTWSDAEEIISVLHQFL